MLPCRLASDAAPSQPARLPSARQSAPGSARPTQDSALRPIRTAILELSPKEIREMSCQCILAFRISTCVIDSPKPCTSASLAVVLAVVP